MGRLAAAREHRLGLAGNGGACFPRQVVRGPSGRPRTGSAAGRRALRAGAPLAARASAACVAWLLHASIDWDLQVPAVTLPAIVLAGALVAASERSAARRSERRATVSA